MGTPHRSADQHPTERLRVDSIAPSWPPVVAALHKLDPERAPLALRRGYVEALIAVGERMRVAGARFELVAEAQEIVDALRGQQWDATLAPQTEPVTSESSAVVSGELAGR